MRILFVDDALEARSLFDMAFKIEGHSTRLAADGIEAIQAVEEDQFHAIVMDIEMPHMDGWEATKRIRSLPNGLDAPIVMFTGYNVGDERRRALETGANDLLYKPMMPDVLLAHLAHLIAN